MLRQRWIREMLLSCVISLLLIFVMSTVAILDHTRVITEIVDAWNQLFRNVFFNPFSWLFLLIPWIIYRLGRYIYFGYCHAGISGLGRRTFYGLGIPVLVFLSVGYLLKNYRYSESNNYTWDRSVENNLGTVKDLFIKDSLQRGIHLFGRRSLASEEVDLLIKNNIEWVTLVPYGWQESTGSTSIGRSERSYKQFTSRDTMYLEQIQELKDYGLKIMLKPHIWMHRNSGGWRSEINFESEQDWNAWKQSYRKFILHYARMASLAGCEQFCVGTELHMVAKEQPEYWRRLIREIRSFYDGKLTYAANWYEEVEDVRFWDELDYIGIQAYYPLSEKNQPSVKLIMKGWKKHLNQIKSFHLKYNKPILFTELGYKSTLDAAKEPWTWVNSVSQFTKISTITQANCYEAFFRTFWDKSWFSGVHLWQWHTGQRGNRGRAEINFTPQNKPAENVMAKWYGQTR